MLEKKETMDIEMTSIKVLEQVIESMSKDHEAKCSAVENRYQQKLNEIEINFKKVKNECIIVYGKLRKENDQVICKSQKISVLQDELNNVEIE